MKSMMEFMKYGTVAREVLKSNPAACGTATALANYILKSEHVKTAGMVVCLLGAVVGAALLGPAGIAAATGGATAVSAGTAAAYAGILASAPISYSYVKSMNRAIAADYNAVETEKHGQKVTEGFTASQEAIA